MVKTFVPLLVWPTVLPLPEVSLMMEFSVPLCVQSCARLFAARLPCTFLGPLLILYVLTLPLRMVAAALL